MGGIVFQWGELSVSLIIVVKAADIVKADDPLLTLESEKAMLIAAPERPVLANNVLFYPGIAIHFHGGNSFTV